MRKDNWRQSLGEYLSSLADTEFKWGTADCCLCTFKAVEVVTGVDRVTAYRGHYTTELGSKRILRSFGFTGIEEAVTDLLGDPLEHALTAQAGDVAAVEIDGVLALGVVFGRGVYCISLKGLEIVDPMSIKTAWRVE